MDHVKKRRSTGTTNQTTAQVLFPNQSSLIDLVPLQIVFYLNLFDKD